MRSRHVITGPLRRGLLCVTASVALATLVACTPRIDSHGNLPDPDSLAEIKPGAFSKSEVQQILGTPSTQASFSPKAEIWYYVSERTETIAFFEPRVTERLVVAISFDQAGMVSEVRKIGLDQGRDITPVDRKTATLGNELTIIDQLIGNLGRFNRGPQ